MSNLINRGLGPQTMGQPQVQQPPAMALLQAAQQQRATNPLLQSLNQPPPQLPQFFPQVQERPVQSLESISNQYAPPANLRADALNRARMPQSMDAGVTAPGGLPQGMPQNFQGLGMGATAPELRGTLPGGMPPALAGAAMGGAAPALPPGPGALPQFGGAGNMRQQMLDEYFQRFGGAL